MFISLLQVREQQFAVHNLFVNLHAADIDGADPPIIDDPPHGTNCHVDVVVGVALPPPIVVDQVPDVVS